MCCAPGQSRAEGTRRRRSVSSAISFLFGLTAAVAAVSPAARAASVALAPPATPAPAPAPTPSPSRTGIDFDLSAGATLTNLGSNFLERLGNQATSGLGYAFRNNPAGGGASEATDGPRYRAWGEAYGISTRTGAQLDFVGDRRQIWGGVAGVGATVAPGVNLGVSVDQSRTAIDVPLALQSATLDLTQFGFNASIDKGPWTWAIALVHGFGTVNSSRDTGLGIANASYNGRIDGALTELSYYWSLDQ